MQSQNVIFTREQWIKEAEKAEQAGAVNTSQAIVGETIAMGVEDEDRKKTWIEDAESVCSYLFLYRCNLIFRTVHRSWVSSNCPRYLWPCSYSVPRQKVIVA